MATMATIFKIYYTSSPEPKGLLTWYLVGSVGAVCWSKISKINRNFLENPSWLPQLPYWQSILNSSLLKDQLTWNLVGSNMVTCRSKIAKIILIGNPRWPPWQLSWKSILNFFSWTEMPTWKEVYWTSSLELKDQLTWNLVGSIRLLQIKNS